MWSQVALILGRVGGAKYSLSCYGCEWLFHAVKTQKACCVASISSKYLQRAQV